MSKSVDNFNEFRLKMNGRIRSSEYDFFPRFFALDADVYREGAIDVKTKELIGLTASLVSKCDDCIKYHLINCYDLKLTEEELFELLAIANMAGGSVLLPTIRRALAFWDELKS